MAVLLSVEEVIERILDQLKPLPPETIPLDQALGRVLARPIVAPLDLPPFANSSVDGFAVRAADVSTASPEHPVELTVIADIPAGVFPHIPLSAGCAAQIMTGAPLPDGADAVVPVEHTNLSFQKVAHQPPSIVRIFTPVRPGDNIRPKGQDLTQGQLVFAAGHRLRPQDLGLLAALGMSKVEVHGRPRIALFSSGDELLPPGSPLTPGKIYDSNRLMLRVLIEQTGGEAVDLGIVADTLDAVHIVLNTAVEKRANLLLSSGGVSVGTYDHVRGLMEREGEVHLWRVNIRPGKPLLFGKYRGVPVLSLPGNPVSAFVGFLVFVRPAIYRMAGLPSAPVPVLKATLEHAVESDGRKSYLRAIVRHERGERLVRLAGHQGSGNLYGLVQANAILIVPAGVKSIAAGSEVEIWPLENFLGQ
ncbi:gephyrin-like molybdotransferase Glp [uncultured Thermanaerothrix sp.]|uniref:molybdopterin molybdotransferase MoeA n=1 Tax=uncultured Thermanaerothrix sp. TaxID=1195149 RepID=UPI002626C987|nr:gephyrin-like molybdotransferase Glp [uncultured Thermanaerothrix sp.]